MELMLLRLFQRQVLLQVKFIVWAAEDLNEGLKQQNVERVFYAIQSMLSSQANISKALWGEGRNLATQRAPLRASIGVDDSSAFNTTAMRNNYDHYDERLERWWRESTNRMHLELIIAPRSAIEIAGIGPKDWFRSFDPESSTAYFWEQEFNIQALINEVKRVLPKLQEEAGKPHW